jgi:hypothetical protein
VLADKFGGVMGLYMKASLKMSLSMGTDDRYGMMASTTRACLRMIREVGKGGLYIIMAWFKKDSGKTMFSLIDQINISQIY